MIKRFWHVGITVDDIDTAISEYKQLGFTLKNKFEREDLNALAASLEYPNGSALELWQWQGTPHPQAEFIGRHLAFESDDLDADAKKYIESGWEVVIPKTKGKKAQYVFLRDKSGNCVEIAQLL